MEVDVNVDVKIMPVSDSEVKDLQGPSVVVFSLHGDYITMHRGDLIVKFEKNDIEEMVELSYKKTRLKL